MAAPLLSEEVINLKRVTLDSIKLRAAAGDSFRCEETLKSRLAEIKAQFEAFKNEVDKDGSSLVMGFKSSPTSPNADRVVMTKIPKGTESIEKNGLQ